MFYWYPGIFETCSQRCIKDCTALAWQPAKSNGHALAYARGNSTENSQTCGDNWQVTGVVLKRLYAQLLMPKENTYSKQFWQRKLQHTSGKSARRVLTSSRVRHVMLWGNQIHSVNLWTLGIQKNVYENPRLQRLNSTLKCCKLGNF